MKNYSEISNRYMKENKKRTALTVLGITLATVLIFAVGTFLLSFRDSMIASNRAKGDYEFQVRNINSEQAEKVVNNAEVKDSSIYESGEEYSLSISDRKTVLEKGNKDYFDKIYTGEVLEGHKPKKEGEVIIDVNVKNILKTKVGDEFTLTNSEGKTTKINIVGISEQKFYTSNGPLVFSGYVDDLDSSKNYYVYVNLKSGKNKQQIVDKVIKDANIQVNDGTKINNSELLYLTGNGPEKGITGSLYKMAVFVIVVIMICTVTVIYNSFNISVIERIKYFGILKAIGATPKQIKRIILKEGAVMGMISLPLGCLIGYFSLTIGVKLFIGDSLIFVDNFKVQFYPIIIAVTIALVSVTIWISILGPARKARRVSAVEAMRNKNEIKLGNLKRRRGNLIGKVFGVEGSLAYKNIRRTPVRFVITVIALTISIILFNVFYGFLDYAKQSIYQVYGDVFFDSELAKGNEEPFTKDEVNDIEGKEFTKNIYKYNIQDTKIALPNEFLNKEFDEKTGLNSTKILDLNNYSVIDKTSTYIGGEKELRVEEKYISEGKFDLEGLKNGGIILIDGKSVTHKDGTKEVVRFTNYKVGDKVKIPKLKSYNIKSPEVSDDKIKNAIENNQYYEATIVAIAQKDPMEGQFLTNDRVQFMIHKDFYSKHFGEFLPNGLFVTFDGDKEARERAVKYFDETKDKGYFYSDLGTELDKMDQFFKQVKFFVYCFIIIITVISVVNIFNTISTNLLLRKKEFATLKAIGMMENQLKKSVMLEGTLYGIIASIVGGITSAILLALLIKFGGGIADIKYNFAIIPFIASIVVAILVTYLSTLIPLKRIKKLTIVEGISDDE